MVGAVLTTVKATALTLLFAIPVVHAVAGPDDDQSLADRYHAALQRQLVAHHCSTSRLPGRAIPASALVRTPAGRLRLLDYADAVRSPSTTLVAVCTDRVR